MSKETDIKQELLKQMQPNPKAKSTRHILARDLARIKRLKWITIFTWLIVAMCFGFTSFLEYAGHHSGLITDELALLNPLIMILRALFLIAAFLTVSLYIRSRTLTIRQIQIRLTGIEEQLRKMTQDKSAASNT